MEIPRQPVVFRNGEALPPDSRLWREHSQNLWNDIIYAQLFSAKHILGFPETSTYSEPSETFAQEEAIEFAKEMRALPDMYRDDRGIGELSFAFDASAEEIVTEFEGKKILDIGSGTGVLAAQLRDLDAHVTEIDFSPETLAGLEPVPDDRGERLVMDGTDMSFADGTFDTAISLFSTTSGVAGVRRRLRAFTEAIRVVRPGGSVFVWPLLESVTKHQIAWFANVRLPQNEPAVQEHRAFLIHQAALRFAVTSLMHDLQAKQKIQLTPILNIWQEEASTQEIISGIIDVQEPLSRAEGDVLIEEHVAPFLASWSAQDPGLICSSEVKWG